MGGPVNWSITESGSLAGRLTVSPSSGSLAAGQSATVALSVSGLALLDSQVNVSPGVHTAAVVFGENLTAQTFVGVLTVNPGGHQVMVVITGPTPSQSPTPTPTPTPTATATPSQSPTPG
ncbi:MAG: hypothetical protein ACRDOA_24090, partial [Streptosporangiaceae bacterium]